MSAHPYRTLPSSAFWRDAVAAVPPDLVDPVTAPRFTLSRSHRIATAGSCFAQHIARHLRLHGYSPLVTEALHPLIPAELASDHGYGLYTARYGNIYTSRQLLQLFERSYGLRHPADDAWRHGSSYVDPFRPAVQPGGYASLAELRADREGHLRAVREAVECLDCLVFTLGLTECWRDRWDGSVYPLCPGVSGGAFDPERHEFCNLSVAEVIADLEAAVAFVRARNGRARFILTVSPVPLVATASGQHVLAATTYSKSVLRVAAQHLADRHETVAYFPSYEIVTGAHARGAFFAADLRSVTEEGVAQVMATFLRHYGAADEPAPVPVAAAERPSLQSLVKLVCEEEALRGAAGAAGAAGSAVEG